MLFGIQRWMEFGVADGDHLASRLDLYCLVAFQNNSGGVGALITAGSISEDTVVRPLSFRIETAKPHLHAWFHKLVVTALTVVLVMSA